MFGEIIEQDQAKTIGRNFLRSKMLPSMEITRGNSLSDDLELSYTWCKEGKNCFYVYNTSAGGFVIVSADSRTVAPVLGYSTEGVFDYLKLGDNARGWLDKYADMVCALDTLEVSSTNTTRGSIGKAVEPLLKNIAWDQGSPYNLMCPKREGEMRSLTGCVATAAAQIMYYHKWPEHGTGIVSNNIDNYQTKIDLSQSQYRWDLMEPTYNKSSSKSSQEAVALLMRDIGYAIDAVFSPFSTMAMDTNCAIALFENFDYSAAISYYYRDYLSDLEWDNLIMFELDNNRPCLYSGGAHCFVCDGYDEEGYFHFNFGWSGSANGYFLSTVAGGFSEGQSVVTNIMKNGGEEPNLVFRTNSDIYWDEEGHNITTGPYMLSYIGKSHNNYGVGAFIENKETGEITFPDKPNQELFDKIIFGWGGFIHKKVPDGHYNIYFGIGDYTKREWKKVQFPNNEESYVSLTVTNGEYYYENHLLPLHLGEGIIQKDGIFYSLNSSDHTASVTHNGKRGCYNGNVKIPNTIELDGVEYAVVEISELAFAGSKSLKSVFIPKNIETIGKSAFAASNVVSITFEPESKLKLIGNSSFYYCESLEKILLPDGLLVIQTGAFSSCTLLAEINIPSSVETIEESSFDLRYGLRDVTVNWMNPKTFKEAFIWGDSEVTLHVPEGTIEVYSSFSDWSKFKIIEGNWSEKIMVDDIWYNLNFISKIAKITSPSEGVYEKSEMVIPEHIEFEDNIYTVQIVGNNSFENSQINKIVVPPSVIEIQENAFYNSLLEYIIFDGESELEVIRSFAFAFSRLKEISLPTKLKIISDHAFWGTDLSKIEIPSSVQKIGFNPFPTQDPLFWQTNEFSDIIVKWEVPIETGFLYLGEMKHITLHVPKGSAKSYENSISWSCFNIDENSFEEKVVTVEGIRYLLNPNSMTASVLPAENEMSAYKGNIVLPPVIEYEGHSYIVKEIKSNAFGTMTSLSIQNYITAIFLPKSIERIGRGAFWGSPLTSIKIEDGSQLRYIGDYAFRYCQKLESFPYCPNLEEIGFGCFVWCPSLKELHIPRSIKTIGDYAFTTNGIVENVYVYGSEPIELDLKTFEEEGTNNLKDMTLYVPKGTKEKYEKVSPWRFFGNIIEIESTNGVENISLAKTRFNYVEGGIEIVGDYTLLQVYDLTGNLIKSDKSDRTIHLNRGIYVLKIDGKSIKIAIP